MTQESFLVNLQTNVSVTSKNPPIISVSVKNTHSSEVATILKWESPLDPAALALGLVSVIPAGTTEPIRINALKISRAMPPGSESLVTLGPGESATNTLELREPIVPGSVWASGDPATVWLSGRWMAVWLGLTKDDLQKDMQKLQAVGAGVGSLIGRWESNKVLI
ncbi:hypothetical protein PFICI_12292 [Pestalotiopsis fici W106-1]|uniref:Uncharacterized protein n=1 Tax=Pestalotiopsis fici (strain W106-1 / CGMCC3.15140) TaxID=1229662 RepID=W3WNB4_PESFW|nr:uncharacterized protein PFICI_12292 [Pestalotiopsis fici W106-1]ETS75348.1 hypothetical protein PFICI_12292 [Pestalotiopsis fici W106-1]